jgi:hypothetical protein
MINEEEQAKWDIVFPSYLNEQNKFKGRYGFEGHFYNGRIFYFFGCQIFDKMRKERTCLNQIVIYDPFANDMAVKYANHEPERLLIPRKYFSGFFLDNSFFSLGGIDTSGKILDSFI